MSNKHKTAARKLQASAIEKGVLNILADHADQEGYCFPSVRTIALGSGLGETSVMTAVQQLEAEGLLRVERQHGEVNKYYVQLSEIEDRASSGRTTMDWERRRSKRAERAGVRTKPESGIQAHADRDRQHPPAPLGSDAGLWRALNAARRASLEQSTKWRDQAVADYAACPTVVINRALMLMLLYPKYADLPSRERVTRMRVIATYHGEGEKPCYVPLA